MIQFRLAERNGNFVGFSVSGHAMFDEAGRDIVCAAVSSAVQLTVNGITEILHQTPTVQVTENNIQLVFDGKKVEPEAQSFLQALALHIRLLSEDYPGTILITKSEV